jgi:type IX secretion system PorP/SprF family membrane protein
MKLNTALLTFFLACLACLETKAQQLPLFSVYREQWKALNPASISDDYRINKMNISLAAGYRRQWMGAKDGPSTQVVRFEYIPPGEEKIVTGGYLLNDRAGKLGQTGVYGNFAYRLGLGRRFDHALVFGLAAGVVQYRARLGDIEFAQPEITGFDQGSVIYPDFGFGAFYYNADRFYAGLSVPQVFGLRTVFRDSLGERAFDIRRVQHIYGVVGAYIGVGWFGSSTSFVEPSAWVRYAPHSPLSLDLNIRYHINDFFWLGLGAGAGTGQKLSPTLHCETGVKLGETINIFNGQWKIGFAYDIPLSRYRPFLGNVIEVNLVYAWFTE